SVIDEQLSRANPQTEPDHETDLIGKWRERWQLFASDTSGTPEIQKSRNDAFKRLEDLLTDEKATEPTKPETKAVLKDIFTTSKYAIETS
ncbi:hypothetical protein N8612_05965, partial [Verrucomicrobia bacterium]|nr:hypothetical protein [Verrucomicrobiota bacterium]